MVSLFVMAECCLQGALRTPLPIHLRDGWRGAWDPERRNKTARALLPRREGYEDCFLQFLSLPFSPIHAHQPGRVQAHPSLLSEQTGVSGRLGLWGEVDPFPDSVLLCPTHDQGLGPQKSQKKRDRGGYCLASV